MPELPEVEYTARQLRSSVIGATIQEALVFWERTIGYPDLPRFLAHIAGQRIVGIRRRGKYLLLDLSLPVEERQESSFFLAIHRRMTGNLLLLPAGWEVDTHIQQTDLRAWNTKGPTFRGMTGEQSTVPNTAHCRVCFHFVDGRRLLFTDPRKFGRLELWPSEREQEVFQGLGREPLSDEFTVQWLIGALARRATTIKQMLLTQGIVAGLGNIYTDEALFSAAIHPARPAHSLTPTEIRLLHEGIISVLSLGIEHGGTSFNDYRDLWGESGDHYSHIQVYHQEGKPCPRCGTCIERIVIAQRSTHFCPQCQR